MNISFVNLIGSTRLPVVALRVPIGKEQFSVHKGGSLPRSLFAKRILDVLRAYVLLWKPIQFCITLHTVFLSKKFKLVRSLILAFPKQIMCNILDLDRCFSFWKLLGMLAMCGHVCDLCVCIFLKGMFTVFLKKLLQVVISYL